MTKVIVDTNIVFSALLNTNSRIGQLLISPEKVFEFYAPEFLREEIFEHRDRLEKLIGLKSNEFIELYESIVRHITVLNSSLIPNSHMVFAHNSCKEVDEDDTEFIACAEFVEGKLWTGDLKLMKGLRKLGYDYFTTTETLFDQYLVEIGQKK